MLEVFNINYRKKYNKTFSKIKNSRKAAVIGMEMQLDNIYIYERIKE